MLSYHASRIQVTAQIKDKLSHDTRCLMPRYKIKRTQQHIEQPRQRKAQTPASLPLYQQQQIESSNTSQTQLVVISNLQSSRLLQNVAESESCYQSRQKTIAAHRQAAMTVCLRRASEQASPLTRAAKSKRKKITLEKRGFVFWQCIQSSYCHFDTPNTTPIRVPTPCKE